MDLAGSLVGPGYVSLWRRRSAAVQVQGSALAQVRDLRIEQTSTQPTRRAGHRPVQGTPAQQQPHLEAERPRDHLVWERS